MKWLITFGVVAIAVAGFAYWFFSQPGPRQLDMVNNVIPGDGDAKLLVSDQVYDEELGLGLNIWAPTEASDKPLPVVVFIYGGGWRAGSKDEYAFAGRALAHRGYITVLADYRLYPEAKFPGFLEDSAKAVAWVHDNIEDMGGDPDRIFLSGQSAGAYNVMMLALDRQWLGRLGKTPDLIKGVAALAGPYDFYPFDSETTKNSFGSYRLPEMTQPVNFVRADAPPLWLSTGIDDTQVRPRNSRILRDKILEIGGDAEYTEYPDMDHIEIMMAIAKPFRSKGPVLDDMIAFFRKPPMMAAKAKDGATLSPTSAIILAGSRPGGDAMADSRGIAVKALIPVAGKAMLAHVAEALLGHEAIGTVHLLAQDFSAFWEHPDTQALESSDRVIAQTSSATIAASLDNVLDQDDTRYPMLITTADNVLLNRPMIDDFLAAAESADIAIAMVEKDVLLASYPASQRTWLKLRGGQYSGANLFYFGSPKAKQLLAYWAEVEQDRKKGWKILTIFGPWLLFLAVTKMLTIHQLAERVGHKLGLKITIVPMKQAEACIDVDKETDLVLAEQILAKRAGESSS